MSCHGGAFHARRHIAESSFSFDNRANLKLCGAIGTSVRDLDHCLLKRARAKIGRVLGMASTQINRLQAANIHDRIVHALSHYREPEPGKWHSPLWQVARACKKFPCLRKLDGYQCWLEVRQIYRWERLRDADTRLILEDDVATAWAAAWDNVRVLPGESLLSAALREADANPVVPPLARSPFYGRFLSLCAVLGRRHGKKICIGVERWAKLLNVRTMTISQWRRWAVKDEILEQTQAHSHSAHRATEFRVVLERLPLRCNVHPDR